MPYRDPIEALQERYDTLLRELHARREHTRTLDELRAQEVRVEAELHDVATRLSAMQQKKRPLLPLLQNIAIASPCHADWNKMTGDTRVRFCGDCKKNVYNLSEMAAADAERLLAESAGGEMCVRLYRRTDGTVLTQDCAIGVKKKRRRKIAFGVAGGAALLTAAASSVSMHARTTTMGAIEGTPRTVTMGQTVEMGDVATPKEVAPLAPVPSETARQLHTGKEPGPNDVLMMGKRSRER